MAGLERIDEIASRLKRLLKEVDEIKNTINKMENSDRDSDVADTISETESETHEKNNVSSDSEVERYESPTVTLITRRPWCWCCYRH
jgi:methyl-accepting chemotaxis protein